LALGLPIGPNRFEIGVQTVPALLQDSVIGLP